VPDNIWRGKPQG